MLRSVVIRSPTAAPLWRVLRPSIHQPRDVSVLQGAGLQRVFAASAPSYESVRALPARPFAVVSVRSFTTDSFEMPRQPRKSNPRRSDGEYQKKPRGEHQSQRGDHQKPRGEFRKPRGEDQRPRRDHQDRRQQRPAGRKPFIEKKVSVYTGPGSSDAVDWRAAVEEFERTIHVHGDNGKYAPGDVYSIVKACVAHGRHREAQSVVRIAQSAGIPTSPATQAQMCAIQARKGGVDAAFDLLKTTLETAAKEEVAHTSVDARLFDPLLSVLKEQHDWQNIRRAIQLMHEFKIEPPIRVFRVLMIASAKAKKKDVLLKTVEFLNTRFGEEPVDVVTLTAMCQALTEAGETRKVMDIYHEMDQDWLNENGATILFNNFVLAALRHGRMYKAVEIFERMKVSDKFPPDDFTFATCILEFEKRGEWDQVIRFFNEMQDRELRRISAPHSINALSIAAVIRALHKRDESQSKRDIERDMQVVLQRLERVEIKQFGHSASLIDVLEENGYRKEAQRIFQRMVENNVISTPWLRQDGYEVDLHSFSRGLAKCAVVYAFQQARINAPVRKVDDMRIITGVGKRSKQFLKPVVPEEVTQLLLRSFRPLIRPMPHPTNPGVLLIRSKIIKEWLDQNGSVRYFE